MIVSVDFDGTIVRGIFPAIESLMPDARQYINLLYDEGHYIIINTCRSGDDLLKTINYLLQNGIKFHRINDNEPENVAKYNSNSRKIYAHIYVEDKQIGGLPAWSEIYRYISEKENEWKNGK